MQGDPLSHNNDNDDDDDDDDDDDHHHHHHHHNDDDDDDDDNNNHNNNDNNDDDDDEDDDDDDGHHHHHHHIERWKSRFFCNLLTAPRPASNTQATLKWPGRNRVHLTCSTQDGHHVQHGMPRGTKE